MADWNKNNPEKKKANDRNRHLRDKYGESMMEQFGVDGQAGYEYLLEKQNHECFFCGINEKDTPEGTLCHDHCHKTGRVRGLLCHACNKLLGIYENAEMHRKKLLKVAGDKLQDYLKE